MVGRGTDDHQECMQRDETSEKHDIVRVFVEHPQYYNKCTVTQEVQVEEAFVQVQTQAGP
jgi:hypothetical protein